MQITLSYQDFSNFKHYCQINDISILETTFADVVCCKFEILLSQRDKFMYEINKKQLNIQKMEIIREKNIKKLQ